MTGRRCGNDGERRGNDGERRGNDGERRGNDGERWDLQDWEDAGGIVLWFPV